MAKPSFKEFVLSKYPNLAKSQLDQLDSLEQRNTAEQAIKQGKLSVEDLPADQRAAAVANLSPEDIGRKNTVDAQKSMQGLMQTFNKLKEGVDTVNIGNSLLGKLGLNAEASNFNTTKALAGRYLAKLVEKNRISNEDAKFYQDQINNFSPIGVSDVQKSKIDNIMQDLVRLTGFKPEELGVSNNRNSQQATQSPEITKDQNGQPQPQNYPVAQLFNKFGQNAMRNVNDIWSGAAQLPVQLVQSAAKGGPNRVITDLLLGQANEYANVIKNPVEAVTQRPASTFLDVLPFIGAMKGNLPPKGSVSTIAGEAPKVTPKVVEPVTKPTLLNKVLGKAGNYLREDVVKIETEPSIWGAQKEAAIKQTLKDLNIRGGPEQQYQQLAPAMEELGKKIDSSSLYEKPKTLSVGSIVDDFEKNLSSEVRRSTLDKGSVRSLAEGYIQDVYSAANDGRIVPEKIQTPDLFKLKKLVNDDYQAVARKLKNNVPLTDKERIVAVARQTLDDVISTKHPDVKKYTVMQSHLYDAVDSIYNARKAPGKTLEILGSKIPIPKEITMTAEDAAGRALQDATSVDKVLRSVR